MEKKKIYITGMRCASCEKKITDAVLAAGATRATVSFVTGEADIERDHGKTDLDKIIAAIAAAGYGCSAEKTGKGEKPAGKGALKSGLLAGLLAHSFCIAFLIATVVGSTVAISFFRPFLLNPYFFYILVGISFAFATAAAALYLRKQGCLSRAGVAKKWRYLTTLYGSVIVINVLFLFVIFPLTAGTASFGTGISGFALADATSTLTLSVAIPCPGHAPLITDALKGVSGVTGVRYQSPKTFTVSYDGTQATREQILALDVFKSYSATVVADGRPTGYASNSSQAASYQGCGCAKCSGR